MGNYLIERGANLNIESYSGWTILKSAVMHDNIDFVRKLINKGAEVNYITSGGTTALDAYTSSSKK